MTKSEVSLGGLSRQAGICIDSSIINHTWALGDWMQSLEQFVLLITRCYKQGLLNKNALLDNENLVCSIKEECNVPAC